MPEDNAAAPGSMPDVAQLVTAMVAEVEASRARVALLHAVLAGLAAEAPPATREHIFRLLSAVAENYVPSPILAALPGATDAARIQAVRYAAAIVEGMTPRAGKPVSAAIIPFPAGDPQP